MFYDRRTSKEKKNDKDFRQPVEKKNEKGNKRNENGNILDYYYYNNNNNNSSIRIVFNIYIFDYYLLN